MIPLTIELMKELIVKRINAKFCRRCGGSGKFRTIPKYDGLVSSYGQACFDCGYMYKLPRAWVSLDTNGKAIFLFRNCSSLDSAQEFISDLLNVSIITHNEADEINQAILNISNA